MFVGELYDAQKPGAQFLCAKQRALLAYEQGTGKTVISLASAEKLREAGLIRNCLIITLPSITWQWINQIEDKTDSDATLIHAKSKERSTYRTGTFYTVTSYSLFRRDYNQISSVSWDLIICDEAQEFKNNRSKTAKLLKRLNVESPSTFRWALTGTAISNKLEELYSIFYWIEKDFLPPWPTFEKRHIVRNPVTNQITDYKDLQKLNPYLLKRMSRKTQADMAESMPEILPPRILYVPKDKDLNEAEKELLESIETMVEETDFSEGSVRDPRVTKAFNEVRQRLFNVDKRNECFRIVQTLLSEQRRNRVVVFSFYKDPLYELRDQFRDGGIQAHLFTGDQTADEKRRAVEEFRKDSSVLLCSNAGSTGLDLPFANHLIHLDVPFSWGIMDQRSKRIARAGSEWSAVSVDFILVKDSLEEYYYQVTHQKGQLADAVYTGARDEVRVKPESLRAFLRGQASRVRRTESSASSPRR